MDLSPDLINMVKGFEGFTPRAKWDYKQSSVGYGTRAQSPGQVVTRGQAEQMLQTELAKHAASVDQAAQQYGYALAPEQRDALISFSFNTGAGPRVLQKAAGDISALPVLMSQYVNVTKPDGTKQPLPGLVDRRRREVIPFIAAGPQQTVEAAPTQTTQINYPVASIPAAPLPDFRGKGNTVPKPVPVSNDALRIAQSLPSLFVDMPQ